LKKPAGSVRFWFYNKKTEKTEPNRNRQKPEKNRAKPSQNRAKQEKPSQNWAKPKKPSQNRKKPSQNRENRAKIGKTEPNRFEPVFSLKNQTEQKTGRFDPVSVWFRFFFQKNFFSLVTFFDKNRIEPKMITPSINTP